MEVVRGEQRRRRLVSAGARRGDRAAAGGIRAVEVTELLRVAVASPVPPVLVKTSLTPPMAIVLKMLMLTLPAPPASARMPKPDDWAVTFRTVAALAPEVAE